MSDRTRRASPLVAGLALLILPAPGCGNPEGSGTIDVDAGVAEAKSKGLVTPPDPELLKASAKSTVKPGRQGRR